MEAFVDSVKKYAGDNGMFDNCDTVIVGLSAGADSVCLLTVLDMLKNKLGIKVLALHVHHGIRGKEATRDAQFAAAICNERGIEFRCIKAEVLRLAKQWHVTTEEAGRTVRYAEFDRWADELEANGAKVKIAVAHNMNDNAETVLFNIFRGSMLDGLAGIPAVNGRIIRPLLQCKREDIERFLKEKEQNYCTDSTNLAQEYTRNITRHRILPVASKINSKAVEHINNISFMADEMSDFVSQCGQKIYDEIVTDDEFLMVDVEGLKKQHPVIVSWVLRQMIKQVGGQLKDITEVHVRMCEDILFGQTGREANLPYNIVVYSQYDKLIMRKELNKDEPVDKTCIEIDKDNEDVIEKLRSENGLEIKVPCGQFDLSLVDDISSQINKNNYTKYYDYDKMKCGFSFRNRKSKDFIVVNEDGTAKKLNRFFIDNKVALNIRDKIVLFAVGNEIMFIPGYRSGESCHVTEDTKNILKVTYTPDNY